MINKEILVYRDAEELRRYVSEEERPVFRFQFGETQKQLINDTRIVIDITSMVYRVKTVPSDMIAAEYNLDYMEDETVVISRESCADDAIELFPSFFSRKRYIYNIDIIEKRIDEIQTKPIFTYDSNSDLISIRDYCKEKGIHILSFPVANSILTGRIDWSNSSLDIVIDLTSLAYAVEDNKNVLYLSEQFFSIIKNADFIVKTGKADRILEYFPLYFNKQEQIEALYSDLVLGESLSEEKDLIRVVDCDINLKIISEYLDKNLFGHLNFKKELENGLSHFIKLNKANELPVFSVFLYGKSGIGKTEVARLLADALCNDSYLAQINFQNYSSQDALNSLIGSPAGYIGCEHGELSDKIAKSKVGVLLCDEFEKTTRPVFSFFLQLLEEGKFTDSLAREYDLNGYIIIFTSNIQTEAEYKRVIPPELQTRFDLVCEFNEPSNSDKEAFLRFLLQKSKVKIEGAEQLDESICKMLTDLTNYNTSSLREIKREFNNKLLNAIFSTSE